MVAITSQVLHRMIGVDALQETPIVEGSSFRFQKLKQCVHFEWLDEYIERIQLEGASRELDLPLEAEKCGSDPYGSGNSIGATVGDAAGTGELKKLNKQMKKLIELKK
ncbi:hypothetical protein D1007_20279 [Hordeum vulgare]|nr:hypothetical protein D1007_20279 [Hordeum vulgare]